MNGYTNWLTEFVSIFIFQWKWPELTTQSISAHRLFNENALLYVSFFVFIYSVCFISFNTIWDFCSEVFFFSLFLSISLPFGFIYVHLHKYFVIIFSNQTFIYRMIYTWFLLSFHRKRFHLFYSISFCPILCTLLTTTTKIIATKKKTINKFKSKKLIKEWKSISFINWNKSTR